MENDLALAPALPRRPGAISWQRAAGTVAAVAGFALAAWGAVLGWVYWQQERLIFQPEPLPASFRFSEPQVHEVSIPVAGATLSALHLKLPNPKGVVFFLHGNGGNLARWFTNASFYREANFDLFMIDYRGYGKSSGHIESEAQLLADVRAAWNKVAPQYAGRRKVVYGRSLGAALAAALAAEVKPDLTILASPFCSMADMAGLHYPWVPRALLRYPLSTCEAAARIASPLVLFHGDGDELVPFAQSQRILDLAPRAELVKVAGAGHGDLHLSPAYRQPLLQRLKRM
jgi:uncharacterized protein